MYDELIVTIPAANQPIYLDRSAVAHCDCKLLISRKRGLWRFRRKRVARPNTLGLRENWVKDRRWRKPKIDRTHRGYTAEAIARRRVISALIRAAREVVRIGAN
jgi:hypothetical protein